ncbi:MAG: cupredoxin domain-containing protein [Acidimicrobiales bacterium]
MATVARPIALAAVALALISATAGCSKKDSADAIAVTATDDACKVADTSLEAGDLTFAIRNEGSKVTEVYVYGEDDQIMGERENIAPGTSADLTVKLGKGTYEVACKPGQKGDGIRTDITVTGAALAKPKADRTVTFTAHDYGYDGLANLTVAEGETVKFTMTNTAEDVDHEFEVKGPDGKVIGEIGPTKPGKTGTVTLTFDQSGTIDYVCGIEGHEAKGMKGTFQVNPA